MNPDLHICEEISWSEKQELSVINILWIIYISLNSRFHFACDKCFFQISVNQLWIFPFQTHYLFQMYLKDALTRKTITLYDPLKCHPWFKVKSEMATRKVTSWSLTCGLWNQINAKWRLNTYIFQHFALSSQNFETYLVN